MFGKWREPEEDLSAGIPICAQAQATGTYHFFRRRPDRDKCRFMDGASGYRCRELPLSPAEAKRLVGGPYLLGKHTGSLIHMQSTALMVGRDPCLRFSADGLPCNGNAD